MWGPGLRMGTVGLGPQNSLTLRVLARSMAQNCPPRLRTLHCALQKGAALRRGLTASGTKSAQNRAGCTSVSASEYLL